jgi:O-antigen/teichoic acid export membrane protein
MKSLYEKIMGDSLYKNSIYLMLSSAVMAALGFISWIICARLFNAHEIGLATTIISIMSLIGNFSLLGLGTGLVRFLPTSKEKNNKINTCFTLVAIVTIVVSSIFLLGIKKFSPDLFFIKENLLLAFSFIFFMVLYSWSSLIESIFISFRKACFILTKSTIFGTLRVVLPFAVVGLGAYGIFSSYMIALLAGFIIVFIILIKKFDYRPKFVFYDNVIKRIGKYSFILYVAGFIGGLPLLLLPLIITNTISPTTTAYYFMAMQIANLLFVIPSSTTNSLFAEGSNDENKLKEKTLKSIKIIAFILIPAILAIVFLGQYILLTFGKEYSAQGFNFLRVMALSGILVSINSVFGSVFKVKNRTKQITIASIVGAVTILGLSYLTLTKGYGLIGIGFSYIIGQAIVSLTYWGIYLRIKRKEKRTIKLSK